MSDSQVRALIESTTGGLRSPDAVVAERAEEALVKLGVDAIPALAGAMVDYALDARMGIAQQLNVEEAWDNAEPRALAAVDYEIQRLLESGAPNPCMPAAVTLARLGEPAAAALIDCVENGRDWLSREAAAVLLGHVSDKRALQGLKKAVRFLRRDRVSLAARRAIRAINRRARELMK